MHVNPLPSFPLTQYNLCYFFLHLLYKQQTTIYLNTRYLHLDLGFEPVEEFGSEITENDGSTCVVHD